MVYCGVFLCYQGNMQIASAAIKKMMAGKWVHNEGENKCVMFTESRGTNDSVRINRITDDRSMWFIFFLILQIWWTCWLSESNFFIFFSFIFRLLEQEIRMDFTRGHTSCHFQANSYICDNTLPHYVCILDFSLSVRNVFAVKLHFCLFLSYLSSRNETVCQFITRYLNL